MPAPADITAAATTIALASGAGFFLLSLGLARKYTHVRFRDPLSLITTTVGVTLALTLAACALPMDVLLVSSSSNLRFGVKQPWADPITMAGIASAMGWVYDSAILLLFVYAFGAVPFVYFYFESEDDASGEEDSSVKRATTATRMALITLIILVLFFMIGLLVGPTMGAAPPLPTDPASKIDYLRDLFYRGGLEAALFFALSLAMMLGMCIFVVYTAPGLFLYPIDLIKPKQSFERELQTLGRDLESVQAKIAEMQLAHPVPADMTTRKLRQLDALRDSERFVRRKLEHVQQHRPGMLGKLMATATMPLKAAAFILSICIAIAILTTIWTPPTACPSCPRLALPITSPANPIDTVLTLLARAYPLDMVFLASILIYLMLCTLHGIQRIGVRILFIKLFTLRSGRTMPQGLLLVSVFLVFTLLALMWEVTSVVAPWYSTWGSQRYCPAADPKVCQANPGLVKFCDLGAPMALCTPTVLSKTMTRVALEMPAIATVFYYAQHVSVAVAILALMYGLLSARKSRADGVRLDDSDDEDEVLYGPASSAAASRPARAAAAASAAQRRQDQAATESSRLLG
ncbi:hypothetical protein BC828DRAFT_392967 [Blastocladiella britannica]|nr:hypothetical protein BC828DRAFT_392967 [Blastocladiella britannica]